MASQRQRARRQKQRRRHRGSGRPKPQRMNGALAELLEIYAAVPSPECKGLCSISCAHIGMGAIERRHLRSQGIQLPMIDQRPCPHLDFAGRCSIYEHRPLICRIYGATPQMACEHGCKPTLSDAEGHALMQRMFELEDFTPAEERELEEQTRRVLPREATDGELRARGFAL